MIRIIAIEREYGCGGSVVAEKLAARLGWKLLDRRSPRRSRASRQVAHAVVERAREIRSVVLPAREGVLAGQLREEPARRADRKPSTRTACWHSSNRSSNKRRPRATA